MRIFGFEPLDDKICYANLLDFGNYTPLFEANAKGGRPSVYDQRLSDKIHSRLVELEFDPDVDLLAFPFKGNQNGAHTLIAVACSLWGEVQVVMCDFARKSYTPVKIGVRVI